MQLSITVAMSSLVHWCMDVHTSTFFLCFVMIHELDINWSRLNLLRKMYHYSFFCFANVERRPDMHLFCFKLISVQLYIVQTYFFALFHCICWRIMFIYSFITSHSLLKCTYMKIVFFFSKKKTTTKKKASAMTHEIYLILVMIFFLLQLAKWR